MKKVIIIMALMSSMNVVAGTMVSPNALPWHFNASLGYVNYEGLVNDNVALQRISGARDLFTFKDVTLGIELGVQTGVTSRFRTTQTELDALNGSAIQGTINPFFDVLGTVMVPMKLSSLVREHASNVHDMTPIMAVIENMNMFTKVGMAYRQMYFDRHTMNPKAQINPEVQVGLSKSLSPQASIAFAYQGIYARNPSLRVYGTNLLTARGSVQSIPTQNAGLLIFGWNAS
jgi:hypothetical protein